MKTIKLHTRLFPIFTGTYENIWEITDIDDDNNELEIEYDFKDFLKGIANAYQDEQKGLMWHFANTAPFVKDIRFTGTFESPREYNFSTDTLDFELDIDEVELHKKIRQLVDDQKFREFLHENYSSRDGFISFTPNNYLDLANEILDNGERFDQSIGALLQYLFGEEKMREIEMEVYESWQGNGYGGTDYKSIPYENSMI